MQHRVILYRGPIEHLRKRWICNCGHLFHETVFGIFLEREFQAHIEEETQDERSEQEDEEAPPDGLPAPSGALRPRR